MSHIIFATGDTTRVPKTLRHKSLNYGFVIQSAAKKLETVFKDCSVRLRCKLSHSLKDYGRIFIFP